MDNTSRIDRLEQKHSELTNVLARLEGQLNLVDERVQIGYADAKDTRNQITNLDKDTTSELTLLKHKVDELQQEKIRTNPLIMQENIALLLREREQRISRMWQFVLTLSVGLLVGVIVGVLLSALGVKK